MKQYSGKIRSHEGVRKLGFVTNFVSIYVTLPFGPFSFLIEVRKLVMIVLETFAGSKILSFSFQLSVMVLWNNFHLQKLLSTSSVSVFSEIPTGFHSVLETIYNRSLFPLLVLVVSSSCALNTTYHYDECHAATVNLFGDELQIQREGDQENWKKKRPILTTYGLRLCRFLSTGGTQSKAGAL